MHVNHNGWIEEPTDKPLMLYQLTFANGKTYLGITSDNSDKTFRSFNPPKWENLLKKGLQESRVIKIKVLFRSHSRNNIMLERWRLMDELKSHNPEYGYNRKTKKNIQEETGVELALIR